MDNFSFQIVYNDKKLIYISENFFNLFTCYKTLDDFLKVHDDIYELLTVKQNRKYLQKSQDGSYWYKNLYKLDLSNNKRVILEFKEIQYNFEIYATQSYSNPDEFVVTFLNIDNKIKKEKHLTKYLYFSREKVAHLNNLVKHKDKLSLVGEMMENIAHQWKQPLSNISFLASSMQLQKELETLDDASFTKNVDNIIKNIDYMSQTIQDFRSFLNEEKQKKVFKLNSVIDQTITILKGNIKKSSVHIEYDIKQDCYTLGYENELIQALINILNNAMDALKVAKPQDRTIYITLNKTAKWNYLVVEDNGGGIPQDIMDKIFEHYFTTKGDHGTGIGLFMSKEIIEKHLNGTIRVTNTKIGALFEIKMPVYQFDSIEE